MFALIYDRYYSQELIGVFTTVEIAENFATNVMNLKDLTWEDSNRQLSVREAHMETEALLINRVEVNPTTF